MSVNLRCVAQKNRKVNVKSKETISSFLSYLHTYFFEHIELYM